MNRELRRRHLGVIAVLAPVAALTLAASVAVRRFPPDNPGPIPTETAAAGAESGRHLLRGDGLTVDIRQQGASVLEVRVLGALPPADVLVYLSRGASTNLADATLLGALDGSAPVRFALPPAIPSAARILLYSPALARLLAADSVSLTP